MRVITLNVNGIARPSAKALPLARPRGRGTCVLQELKAQHEACPAAAPPANAPRTSIRAQRKGYSGVGIYVRGPAGFATGFGSPEFDAEGRYLEAHFAELSVISLYLPSGSSGPHRQASKFRFLAQFLPHLVNLRKTGREIILCGDWNIAHQNIDLTNWRSNRKNSGFLPEEREWLTRVFDELGFWTSFAGWIRGPSRHVWPIAAGVGETWLAIDYPIATPEFREGAHRVGGVD